MGEDVKIYVQGGIHFSNELMDVIEDVSQKYQEHISVSMEIGNRLFARRVLMVV